MGWIMDVTFDSALEVNGFKVRAGDSTQVRWDLGIGSIRVGADGKISEVYLAHPADSGHEHDEYVKMLSEFSGVMDSTSFALCFYKGQLVHLDFVNGHALWGYLQTYLYKETGSIAGSFKFANGSSLDSSHPDPEKFMSVINKLREELNEGIVRAEEEVDKEEILAEWRDKTRCI